MDRRYTRICHQNVFIHRYTRMSINHITPPNEKLSFRR